MLSPLIRMTKTVAMATKQNVWNSLQECEKWCKNNKIKRQKEKKRGKSETIKNEDENKCKVQISDVKMMRFQQVKAEHLLTDTALKNVWWN